MIANPGTGPGRVTVYDSSHKALATVPARAAGNALVAPLPHLPGGAGVYSVVWRAGGQSGSFAFQVSPGGASPTLIQEPQPESSLTPVKEALPKYFAFAFIFIFIGTLSLRFLVTAPTIRRLAGDRPRLRAAVDRRLLLTAGVTIALFIPSTLLEFSNEETNLWSTADGRLWLARFVLTALAAIVVIPAAVMALRRRELSSARVRTVAAIGLAAAVGELLARVIPTETPEEWVREIFTDVLDWGHMTGASVWIGCLVALAVLGATLRLSAAERDGFWSAALRRFSVVATVCVGVMILTGLWTAWIHVGPPRLLFHTLYGETLLVKLILVLILVGLGAINQLWLLPRVPATSLGSDHYRISGRYTPMVGDWRARVLLDGGIAAASFPLVVTAKYEEPESPPPPPVRGSTWAWGIAETIATILALVGAGFASTWITRWRRRRRSLATGEAATESAG